jgi:cysteine dioxygenase
MNSLCIREEGHAAFIDDSMGYHKIGNPSLHNPAVTLHLYCPPFAHCKVWMGLNEESQLGCVTHYSEFGQVVQE